MNSINHSSLKLKKPQAKLQFRTPSSTVKLTNESHTHTKTLSGFSPRPNPGWDFENQFMHEMEIHTRRQSEPTALRHPLALPWTFYQGKTIPREFIPAWDT